MEQFNAIAGKAGAKTSSYGPFVNPNVLLSSVNLQNAKTQEELQSLLERAMNSRLAPPKELPAPEEVFQAAQEAADSYLKSIKAKEKELARLTKQAKKNMRD